MKIAIASDHAGFVVKEKIKQVLQNRHQLADFGTFSEEACDYPEFALSVANAVSRREADRGILICGTGVGMAIVANKVKGVRAALCADEHTTRLSREHNDTNVICLGARTTPEDTIEQLVELWLMTPFKGGHHERRVAKIKGIEDLL